jgi:quercetin dioxygenase-like cupin family protein
MALSHAVPGQIFDVRPLGADLQHASSVAVFKSEQLEVLRVVLLAGRCFPEHQVAGEITVQCLEGVIEVTALGRVQQLRAGDMLFLVGRQAHALVALEDASALMTLCLSPARAN